jgi:hypothetical protein
MESLILFPLGVRLSTWLLLACFVALAVRRRDQRALLAAAGWLTGFEACFEIGHLAVGAASIGRGGVGLFPIIVCTASVVWLTRHGIRPEWRLLAAAVAILAVWTAFGLRANGHQQGIFSLTTSLRGFDPWDEALNEASKTLWALAYLVPLVRGSVGGQRRMRARPERRALIRRGGGEPGFAE